MPNFAPAAGHRYLHNHPFILLLSYMEMTLITLTPFP